jgi:CSLREA domain-containing protein
MIKMKRGRRALACAFLASLQRRGRLRAALVFGVVVLTLFVGVPAAQAAIITVNTTADELNSDGDCSLREAIAAANTNLPVDACPAGTPGPIIDVITFSVTGTISLTNGQLTVTDDLMIDGPGATNLTVSGNNSSRVIEVTGGVTLDLRDVTVADGSTAAAANGGAGILNFGTLTVTDSIFSGNAARPFVGGGILNAGTLSVASSTFSGNSGVHGGAIGTTDSSPSALTVRNSTFSGNSASHGGGIAGLALSTLTVENSTFSGNSAEFGGGINIFGGSTLTVSNSTLSGNSAVFFGGGILNLDTVEVTNSTFSGNSARPGDGGGGVHSSRGSFTLRNTIVANSPSGGNCAGVIIDGLGNLQFPGMDCGATIPVADPLLGPLAANDGPAPDPPDGPTKTHALQPGSPAIDTAVLASCPLTDQRGVPRPQGAGCDIGAFELEVAAPCPPGDDDRDDDGLDDRSEDVFGNPPQRRRLRRRRHPRRQRRRG